MGVRNQDVSLDFGRLAEIVSGKFQLKTKAELGTLETELQALEPTLAANAALLNAEGVQATAHGVSVTYYTEALAGDPAIIENGEPSRAVIYSYDAPSGKFRTAHTVMFDTVISSLTEDFSLLDLRVGEVYFYDGPAGTAAFTGVSLTFGETELRGGGQETIEIVNYDRLTGDYQILITPITRGNQSNAVTFFTTLNLAIGSNTVTHNLNLVDKDAFVIRVADSTGSSINVDVDSVDVNSLTLTTLLPRTGVRVFVSGEGA